MNSFDSQKPRIFAGFQDYGWRAAQFCPDFCSIYIEDAKINDPYRRPHSPLPKFTLNVH
jgi:hypothetical protein